MKHKPQFLGLALFTLFSTTAWSQEIITSEKHAIASPTAIAQSSGIDATARLKTVGVITTAAVTLRAVKKISDTSFVGFSATPQVGFALGATAEFGLTSGLTYSYKKEAFSVSIALMGSTTSLFDAASFDYFLVTPHVSLAYQVSDQSRFIIELIPTVFEVEKGWHAEGGSVAMIGYHHGQRIYHGVDLYFAIANGEVMPIPTYTIGFSF